MVDLTSVKDNYPELERKRIDTYIRDGLARDNDPYWWARRPNNMSVIAMVLSVISVVISCLPQSG